MSTTAPETNELEDNRQICEEADEMSMAKREGISVTHFTIVYDESNIFSEGPNTFKPDYCHQIYGESESIFGYRTLKIDIKYLHNSCKCYVTSVATKTTQDHAAPEPDDYMAKLDLALPKGYTTDPNEFIEMLNREKHDEIFGDVVAEFKDSKEVTRFASKRICCDYKVTISEGEKTKEFIEFHERFQTYLKWFIDGAVPIELDDPKWIVFYLYEEFTHPITTELYRSPVGLCTVYNFYAFPENQRMRISQFLILPTHQKKGLGTKLYETVMDYYRKNDKVADITVEEPTRDFQIMRFTSDTKLAYRDMSAKDAAANREELKGLKTKLRSLKLSWTAINKIRDIIHALEEYKEEGKNYNKTLKRVFNRIEAEIERVNRPSKRLCANTRRAIMKQQKENEKEKRITIENEFKKIREEIIPVIEKLKAYFFAKKR